MVATRGVAHTRGDHKSIYDTQNPKKWFKSAKKKRKIIGRKQTHTPNNVSQLHFVPFRRILKNQGDKKMAEGCRTRRSDLVLFKICDNKLSVSKDHITKCRVFSFHSGISLTVSKVYNLQPIVNARKSISC